jgi:mannose-1-phosphate guanylyltransferase/mannose-6-phosphate isomerase
MKVIILAGGKGTRLWPLSREKYLKQLKLADNTLYRGSQKILIL